MSELQLKPCPFCGSKRVFAFAQDEDDCPYRSAIARCDGCEAQTAQMAGSNKRETMRDARNRGWKFIGNECYAPGHKIKRGC